jgi:drug/metabolite transporter (DMT)-like permease
MEIATSATFVDRMKNLAFKEKSYFLSRREINWGSLGKCAALALGLAPFGLVAGIPAFSCTWMLPLAMLTLAFVAANMALQFGAARLPARITALVMLSELVFAVLSAIALGGETLGLLTVIGALLILGATLWGLFDVKREGTSP